MISLARGIILHGENSDIRFPVSILSRFKMGTALSPMSIRREDWLSPMFLLEEDGWNVTSMDPVLALARDHSGLTSRLPENILTYREHVKQQMKWQNG